MATGNPTSKIKLDWSRLLGFDQATRSKEQDDGARPATPNLVKLGGKVGGKIGAKPGMKPGT
jgi:hypothetical protein